MINYKIWPVCYGPYDMDDMVWSIPYGINDNTSIRLADNSIVKDSFSKKQSAGNVIYTLGILELIKNCIRL